MVDDPSLGCAYCLLGQRQLDLACRRCIPRLSHQVAWSFHLGAVHERKLSAIIQRLANLQPAEQAILFADKELFQIRGSKGGLVGGSLNKGWFVGDTPAELIQQLL